MKFPFILENSVIPKLLSIFISIEAITLWPFIISRKKLNSTMFNHEMIHIKQQQELLVVGFYLLYVFYWLRGFWLYRDSEIAYLAIPFEQEAYSHEFNQDYLENRKIFSWWKYR